MWYLLILFGFLSGIISGMGMGGGTVLVPLLTIFLNFSQVLSQGYNLLAFLPMALIVIIIHYKNGLLKLNHIYLIIILGIIFAIIGSFFANLVDAKILKYIYGSLLLLLGLIEIVKIFNK